MLNRVLAFILLLSSITSAQLYLAAVGASAGFANFSGQSARQSGFVLIPSLEAGIKGTPGIFIAGSVISIRNSGLLIPEIRIGKNYGSLLGVLAELQVRQQFTRAFYIQGSGGFIYILDKSFPDINTWSAGLSFGALAGLDLKQAGLSSRSFRITAGISTAFTLHNTFPGYQAVTIGFFFPLSN